jgi:hypothetical protein
MVLDPPPHLIQHIQLALPRVANKVDTDLVCPRDTKPYGLCSFLGTPRRVRFEVFLHVQPVTSLLNGVVYDQKHWHRLFHPQMVVSDFDRENDILVPYRDRIGGFQLNEKLAFLYETIVVEREHAKIITIIVPGSFEREPAVDNESLHEIRALCGNDVLARPPFAGFVLSILHAGVSGRFRG